MKPKLKKNSTKSAIFTCWRGDHGMEQLESFSEGISLATPITEIGQKQYAISLARKNKRWVVTFYVNTKSDAYSWERFQTLDLDNEETLCELARNTNHA